MTRTVLPITFGDTSSTNNPKCTVYVRYYARFWEHKYSMVWNLQGLIG